MCSVGETGTPQDWPALARAVTERRVELGHRTLRAFAEASGLSTKTLGEIEGAKRSSYDRATLIQVERALKWPPGAVQAILERGARVVGGVVQPGWPEPAPEAGLTLGRALDALVHPSSDLSERDRQAIRDGMRALLHLGEQAMLAHGARRDVPVEAAGVEKVRDHVR